MELAALPDFILLGRRGRSREGGVGEGEEREKEGSPKVSSHPGCPKSRKLPIAQQFDVIGGGDNTDVSPGRQTPSRRHCFGRDVAERVCY